MTDEGIAGLEQLGAPCEVGVGECLRRAVVACSADGRGVSCGATAAAPAPDEQRGVYDAVDGCHTASPLWPRWRTVIGASSSARVQDRSPDGYVEAFHGEGFEVSVWRFGFQGFVAPPRSRDYCPSVVDALSYPDEHKLLFRLERRR